MTPWKWDRVKMCDKGYEMARTCHIALVWRHFWSSLEQASRRQKINWPNILKCDVDINYPKDKMYKVYYIHVTRFRVKQLIHTKEHGWITQIIKWVEGSSNCLTYIFCILLRRVPYKRLTIYSNRCLRKVFSLCSFGALE